MDPMPSPYIVYPGSPKSEMLLHHLMKTEKPIVMLVTMEGVFEQRLAEAIAQLPVVTAESLEDALKQDYSKYPVITIDSVPAIQADCVKPPKEQKIHTNFSPLESLQHNHKRYKKRR
jgi:hypothetical protein